MGMTAWLEGYNLLDMCSGEDILPGNCISACPWGENWSSKNPFVPLIAALNSRSKRDSEILGRRESMGCDSMSILKRSPRPFDEYIYYQLQKAFWMVQIMV